MSFISLKVSYYKQEVIYYKVVFNQILPKLISYYLFLSYNHPHFVLCNGPMDNSYIAT